MIKKIILHLLWKVAVCTYEHSSVQSFLVLHLVLPGCKIANITHGGGGGGVVEGWGLWLYLATTLLTYFKKHVHSSLNFHKISGSKYFLPQKRTFSSSLFFSSLSLPIPCLSLLCLHPSTLSPPLSLPPLCVSLSPSSLCPSLFSVSLPSSVFLLKVVLESSQIFCCRISQNLR